MSIRSTPKTRTQVVVGCIGLLGAVVGAVLVLYANHLFGHGWAWAKFVEDLIRNVLVAGFVAGGAIVVAENQERRAQADAKISNRNSIRRLNEIAELAANAWNVLPTPDRPAASVNQTTDLAIAAAQASAAELRKTAARVDELDADEGYYRASVITGEPQRSMYFYAAEGQRARRFEVLQYLADELAVLQDVDAEWIPCIAAFRRTARMAIGWRSHTDATIFERLLVESQVSLVSGPKRKERGTEATSDTRKFAQLDPAASTFEPIYLLAVYLALAPTDAEDKMDIVRRPIHAWRNEMLTIADAHAALADVLTLASDSSAERSDKTSGN